MKKGLVLIMTIALVTLLVGAGFAALFSDTETAEDNSYTAGTLELKVDGVDYPNIAHVEVTNMAPGDTEHFYWTLQNVGSICGQPSIEFADIVEYENGQMEAEAAVDGTGGNPGAGNGELGGFLYTLVKWRHPGDSWHEVLMVPHGHTFIKNLSGPYGLGENNAAPLPVLCQDEEVELELRLWWHMRSDDNKAQSDIVEFDTIFHLIQD